MMLNLFISLSLCLRPDCALAEQSRNPALNEVMLSTLLTSHREIKAGTTALELIDRQGKNLLNDTYTFINDPKNKRLLSSAQGKDLLKQQTLLANYIAIKDHLDRCVKNKNDPRKLKDRILNSALSTVNNPNDFSAPCRGPDPFVKSYTDMNNQVMKVMKMRVAGDFLQELNKKIIVNSMRSLLALQYKFDKNFMKTGYLTQPELNKLTAEICFKNSCNRISNQFVSQLQSEAIDYSKKISNQEKRFSPSEAASGLNNSIDQLNNSLDQIKIKKSEGIIFNSADLTDPNTKSQFDQYIFNYMNIASKDAGPLLLTKTLREAAGEIKSFSEDSMKGSNFKKQFQFIPHRHINELQIIQAIKEAHEKIVEQARGTEKTIANEQLRNASKNSALDYTRHDDIDELVKINPMAIGQILVHSPEYAGLACDSINRISTHADQSAQTDKYFMIGSAILGGALLLTGIGTVAGAYMLTGSVTAGIASGTVGGAILTGTVVAGAVTEVAMAAYQGSKSYEFYNEMNKIEQALLSQNTDSVAILEKRDALISFKEARMKSMVSLVSAGLSVGGLDKFFSLAKFQGPGISFAEFKATTKIMEYLSENQVAQKLHETAKLIGSKGSDLLDQFLLRLAKSGEKIRLNMLELLKDSKITPEKLKEIFEEALAAAKKCNN